jgi:glutathione S-transferase
MRVYSTPYSTNVERVALALGFKELDVEWVQVPYDDRAEVERLSGQPLVPVLVDGGLVLPDSPAILRYLDELEPEPPLWPREPARRAEADVFVEWFNHVWKRAPNLMAAELERPEPDLARVDELGRRVTSALDRFEALLDDRDHLLGDEFGIADVVAFPFLKYMTVWEDGDTHLFHQLLRDWQQPGRHPGLEAWIGRVDARPRA